jgi:hypothetical protein
VIVPNSFGFAAFPACGSANAVSAPSAATAIIAAVALTLEGDYGDRHELGFFQAGTSDPVPNLAP